MHLRSFAFFAVLVLCAAPLCPSQQVTTGKSSQFAVGADISFLPQAEQQGAVFKENGVAKPALEILRDHSYNWVRLRIFVAPTNLPNNLEYTIAAAKQAKAMGFRFLLDFHYADGWADPGHQPTPAAWAAFTHKQLVDAVFAYSRDTIATFRTAGVMPDMVQVGNEISNGMIWPDGKLHENWDHFAQLVQAGIDGVGAGCGNEPRPLIMIHIDKGGDIAATKSFFDKLATYNIKFDVIGQSYYPWWQGSLNDLRANLEATISAYGKDVYVVETAYNWEPGNYTSRPGPFPETPEGQRDFLDEVNHIVMEAPGGHGKGVFWWEPAVRGPLVQRGFFDNDGNVLPVIGVYDRYARH
ncbi:MAG: glycosyl hydrolase 53 family protein [Terracidiphilus sp.]